MSYRITFTCFSVDSSCAPAARISRWNWRRKATDGWMSGANASPIGRSHQEMSGANASPIGRSHQEMSGANASPIGRSHQVRSHHEHDGRRTERLRHSVLLDKEAVAGPLLALGGAAQAEGNGRLSQARLSVDEAGELEVHKRGSDSADYLRTGNRSFVLIDPWTGFISKTTPGVRQWPIR